MMRIVLLALTLIAVACESRTTEPAAVTAPKTAAPVMPTAVSDYLQALAVVEQATTPTALEALLGAAEEAQNALMEVSSGVDGKALLETYSDAEFSALQAAARGLQIHRGLDIYAAPDPAFFLALAQRYGRPADIAFFTQYAATWGPDLVPTYLKLRPQPSPCVRFGEGRITPLYKSWMTFAADYPKDYTARAQQNLKDLEEAVALGTCACDGIDSVLTEQAGFLAEFPNVARAGEILARSKQLKTDPETLPVNCR